MNMLLINLLIAIILDTYKDFTPEVEHAVDRTLRLNLSLSETLLESSSGKVRVRKRHI